MATQPGTGSATFEDVKPTPSNVSYYLNPFPPDFALAIPNFLANAASFAFITVPERIDHMLHGGGSVIAQATGNGSKDILSAALSQAGAAAQASNTAATSSTGEAIAAEHGDPSSLGSLTFQQIRSFGGVFMYMTSKWALACFVLVSLFAAKNDQGKSYTHRLLTHLYRLSSSIERRFMRLLDVT